MFAERGERIMDNERAMSELVDEAKAILSRIEAHQDINQKQLEMYKEMVYSSMAMNKDRMDSFEKRWSNTRNVLIAILGLFLLSFVSDKIALDARPTATAIEEEYMTIEDAYRGFGAVVDDVYGTLQTTDDLTHDEATELSIQAKKSIQREIDPNYVERTVVKIK